MKIPLVRNNGDLVNYLMTNAFNKLSYDDKVCIKQLDIKFIKLNSFINTHKNSSNRKFNSSCHWLTGSETKSNFFCWPCLLFNNPKLKSPWCTTGVDNLKTLHQSVEKHGIIRTYAALQLKLFGKQNIENSLEK
jgi:hypothetical protein